MDTPKESWLRSAHADAWALCETYRAYAALSLYVIDGPGCRVVRCDAAPRVYNANFVEIGPDAKLESALAFHDEHLGDRAVQGVRTTPFSPPECEAELRARDFVANPTLQLLLDGPLVGPRPNRFEIRQAHSDADWRELARLFRADHVETDEKLAQSVFDPDLTDQIVAVHRMSAEEIPFFIAWIDSEPVAFFSSWHGQDGVGMVEDLFTMPSHRHRGIARALIHHCVAEARARGAERVLIGAEPDDTPKNLYGAMGFRPVCMTNAWSRAYDQPASPDPT
jgi:GNAT superfamily N-acetyltransferase